MDPLEPQHALVITKPGHDTVRVGPLAETTCRVDESGMSSDLIRRTSPGLAGQSEAVFDLAEVYRYLLVCRWAPGGLAITFIMCNPSTADDATDDPTIRRCTGFAQREGAAALEVVNLFALRSTSPRQLLAAADPVGPHNDQFLLRHAPPGRLAVAAWGNWGELAGRGSEVAARLAAAGVSLMCFGLTGAGQPRHQLYVRDDADLVPFRPGALLEEAHVHQAT